MFQTRSGRLPVASTLSGGTESSDNSDAFKEAWDMIDNDEGSLLSHCFLLFFHYFLLLLPHYRKFLSFNVIVRTASHLFPLFSLCPCPSQFVFLSNSISGPSELFIRFSFRLVGSLLQNA